MKLIKAGYLERSLGTDMFRFYIQYTSNGYLYPVSMSEGCAWQLSEALNTPIEESQAAHQLKSHNHEQEMVQNRLV